MAGPRGRRNPDSGKTQARRQWGSPQVPEYRQPFTDPLPDHGPMDEQFREMALNDPEFMEWKRAERLGSLIR